MRRRWLAAVPVALAATVALSTAGLAHDSVVERDGFVQGHIQHGGEGGHLPPGSDNVKLVSKLKLSNVGEGLVADVGVWKGFAYLARFRPSVTECFIDPGLGNGGVWIADIRNPKAPKEIGFIPIDPGSYAGEGIQTITLDTKKFKGDVLFVNAETCAAGERGGLSMYDVTDPFHPVPLAEHFGDVTVGDQVLQGQATSRIHSVFGWQANGKAYAVMVDDDEQADVDIVDITDPRKPVIIAEHQLDALFPQILQPELGTAETFHHDVIVKKIKGRQIMLVSYWDGGYVKLDMTDPVHPKYLADSDFANPDVLLKKRTGLSELPEGNAHQAEFTKDDKFIIAADEDFGPVQGAVKRVDNGALLNAASGSDTPQLDPAGQPVQGQTRYVGLACPTAGDPAGGVPAGDGSQIAVIERGTCTFTEKVGAVEAAGGYVAALVFNRQGSDACEVAGGMSVVGGIPTFGIMPRSQGLGLFGVTLDEQACLAGGQPTEVAVGTTGPAVNIRAFFDGWGYVHLFRNNNGKLKELDQYAIPQAHDLAFADGFGDLSVHEVATSERKSERAYLSYYSGGFRVIEVEDSKIKEVGHFIDEGGNNFWGVQVFKKDGRELVAASDRDYGLYIFEYTP